MTSTWRKWPITHFVDPEHISKIRMVMVFGDSGNSCLIVTQDQTVYGIGNNSDGCLGTGNSKSTFHPTKIDQLCEKNIKTFACGTAHVLALTTNGEVYAWGKNKSSQLGYSGESSVPKKVHIMEGFSYFVVDIACGANHSVALTNDGSVYAWGYDTVNDPHHYTCYNVSANNGIKRVKLNTNNSIKCVSICCGGSHSMAVMSNGQVYAWGSNSEGQLGHGNTCNRHFSNPSEVVNFNGIVIVKVVCGMKHTLALSNKGSLYTWGDNQYGQLGVSMVHRSFSSSPLQISRFKRVLDIAASNSSNISVAMEVSHLSLNRIYMWGNCLGQSLTEPKLISVHTIHDIFAFYASPNVMHQPLVIDDDDKDDKKKEETTRVLDNLETALDDKVSDEDKLRFGGKRKTEKITVFIPAAQFIDFDIVTTSNTSDLTIEVQGKTIYVHKAILKIRSEYFKRMFEGPWQENNDSVIKDGQFSYVVYRAFLKFLYTGKIDIPAENAVELLQLADFCNDDHLKIRCVDVIMRGISADNAAFIYSVAVKYNTMVLKKLSIQFAVRNMTRVIGSTSFAELSHEMMKTFIIEANEFKVFKT